MKIDNSMKSLGSLTGETKGPKPAKSESGSSSEPGVSVELSTASAQLNRSTPGSMVVDSAKVSEIKQAIAEGRFRINPDVVADRLLSTVRELITTYRH